MNTRARLSGLLMFSLALGACGSSSSPSSSSSGSGGHTGSSSSSTASGSAGSGGSPAATCGAFTPGDDLTVCTATYLGGSGADHLTAVDVAPDGSVILGGAVEGTDLGQTPAMIIGGGNGAVVRLDGTGRKVLGLARVGAGVTDLEVDHQSGAIAVSGDFGVALLDARAEKLLWKQALGGAASRVAVGSDGTVAALAGKTITVLSASGAMVGTIDVQSATSVNDLAVDGASQSVFATGYRQDDGGACSQYKSTFVRGYAYTGAQKWKDYDWTHTDVGASSDCADSQGLALGMGRDGKLYYAGKSDGGNTVHQKDPRDLAKMAPNVSSDQYNTPYGFKGANAIGYYARFDAATGTLEKGQFVVARKGDAANADGNAAVPSAITADEQGNVFVAGAAAYEIQGHDLKKINGTAVGPYVAYEPFVLVVPPAFDKRLVWTVFTRSGPGTATSIAASNGAAVFGVEQSAGDLAKGTLITASALQDAPAGGMSEGWLTVFPAP